MVVPILPHTEHIQRPPIPYDSSSPMPPQIHPDLSTWTLGHPWYQAGVENWKTIQPEMYTIPLWLIWIRCCLFCDVHLIQYVGDCLSSEQLPPSLYIKTATLSCISSSHVRRNITRLTRSMLTIWLRYLFPVMQYGISRTSQHPRNLLGASSWW